MFFYLSLDAHSAVATTFHTCGHFIKRAIKPSDSYLRQQQTMAVESCLIIFKGYPQNHNCNFLQFFLFFFWTQIL